MLSCYKMNRAYGHMQRAQELLSKQALGFGNSVGLQLYKMDNTGQKTTPAGAPLVINVPSQEECDQNRELIFDHGVDVCVVEEGVQLTYESTASKRQFYRTHDEFQFWDGLWLLRKDGEEVTCASNESLIALYDQVHAFVLKLFNIDDEGEKGNLFCPPLLLYVPKKNRHSDMDDPQSEMYTARGFQPLSTQDFHNWRRLKSVNISYINMHGRKQFKKGHQNFDLGWGLWEVEIGASCVVCMSDQSLSEIFDHLNKKDTTHANTQTRARHTR